MTRSNESLHHDHRAAVHLVLWSVGGGTALKDIDIDGMSGHLCRTDLLYFVEVDSLALPEEEEPAGNV